MRLVALILLLCPAVALADPGTLMVIGSLMAGATTTWVVVTGYGLMIGAAVYGADQQRKKAAAEREKQRQSYNAALQDRTATRVATDAPYRYVYGRARVGSDIVAMFASGVRDEYKWLVCVHAAHECDAIEEVYINSKALGELDANGDVTQGEYLYTRPVDATEYKNTKVFTLAHTPKSGSLVITYTKNDSEYNVSYTLVGNVVTVIGSAHSFTCSYQWDELIPRVRVSKHLGAPTDAADAGLMAAVTDWTGTSVLRGFCYTVIRLDLNQAEFQGGVPPVEVLLRGKKLYDPRTTSTVWSQNPALAIRDYLTSEICGVDVADLPEAEYIAAANVCDESISLGRRSWIDASLVYGPRYTINGAVTADQDSRKVLEQMAACMAGGLVGTTWSVWAGKYVAPVMALDQSDIVGSLSVIGGTSDAELYNGVRGRYIGPENSYVPTDIRPYQNAAYLAADGRDLWNDMEFPFTDKTTRIHNLARIAVEDQRNGFTIKASFSLKTFRLKVGNRVTFTSSFLGQANKVYRITDKRYGPAQAVELTLKEDAESIYDLADAVLVDATPNTNLPNPFSIAPLESLTCQSGVDYLQRNGDGTITSRIYVSWPLPTTPGVLHGGYVEVEYRTLGEGAWNKVQVTGDDTDVYLTPVQDGIHYQVRARTLNPLLNLKSIWLYTSHEVAIQQTVIDDLSSALEQMAADALAVEQAALQAASAQASVTIDALGNAVITFDTTADPQILEYELREGVSFDSGELVGTTSGNTFTLPVLGSAGKVYWIRARYAVGYSAAGYRIDFSGANLPAPSAPTWSVVEPNLVFLWAAVAGAAQYLCLFEVGGVTTVKVVATPGVSFPIPKYSAVFRLVAMGADGSLSAFVDEELNISGQYKYNEIVNVALPITTGQYLNLAFTAANTVKRSSLLGNAPVAPYAQNINDGDLYSFGYNLQNLAVSSIQNIAASWFRNGFWREKSGYFESAVVDLGAVLTGSLLLNLTKTVTYVGNAPVSSWAHVSAEYLADADTKALIDQKAFLTARFFVASDSPLSANWTEANNGDWITGRYVKIVVEVAMASPLTEVTITAGAISIDVPDVTETGSTTGVTVAGKAITFSKSYHNVSVVIATARGAAKAYTGSITATGCTLYVDVGTQQVDYFVKGY